MKYKVYIFRGSPLSGKSTLASAFSSLLPKPVAGIRHDMLRWDIHRLDRHFTEVTPDEHRFAFENLVVLFEQYLKKGTYYIVIEGLFTWNNSESDQGDVKTLIELAERYNVSCKSIVLKADKEKLLERNAARPQQVPNDEFNTLYDSIYGIIDPSEIVIDTTTADVDKTLSHLRTEIE